MVACKDDPSHKLRNIPSLHQQSPTQHEQDTRLDRWFHNLSNTPPQHSPHTLTTTTTIETQANSAPGFQSLSRSHPIKHSRPSTNAQSNKRKALAELDSSNPRKSARLEQNQPVPAHQMSTSPSKKKAGKAREPAAHTLNQDGAKAAVSHVVTRGRSQGKVPESSSDKENRGTARDLALALPGAEGVDMTTPLLQPIAVLAPELSSLPKRKDPSSRPSSPTKSNSTKTSKASEVDKRERLALLNPPVQFFTRAYLGKLGGRIQPLVKKLWVDYIELEDQGYIPQALKARIPPPTPNKSTPSIHPSSFANNTKYSKDDYERIWVTVTDVVKTADQCGHMGYHESHWISHVVSPMLKLVSNLKRFEEDEARIIALDIQTVGIDPPTLCSYSSDSHFKDLDKLIDCAVGLHLSAEDTTTLQRGVYRMEGAIDSIDQTSTFVNFVPMFLNIEVKRKNSDKDPLIQLGAWISAEFEKRRIEDYSLDMPVLAIEIQGDQWGLYMVYADEGLADGEAYGLKFVGPKSLGNTGSLQGCFKLLDGLCRCADWGVVEYQSWFRKEVLQKYQLRGGRV